MLNRIILIGKLSFHKDNKFVLSRIKTDIGTHKTSKIIEIQIHLEEIGTHWAAIQVFANFI
jgi:hypothetical protein